MNGWRHSGHRDSLSPLGPDPLQAVWERMRAHSAQTRCPHGINAVSRARSRQTGHSSVPLERSGAGSARGGKLLLPDVLKAPPSAASMPDSGWESRSGCAALFLSVAWTGSADLDEAQYGGAGVAADSCAETPCDHSPPVALTRNE